ncbi:MAG: hypothetical protein M1833_003047 [Piccolia ochrophora]|nr:MAG: hypothetical protein M1833_003047 [Piccolia ochrophora]
MANSRQNNFTNQSFLPNGSAPSPGATNLLPNNGRVVQAGGARILCVADVRGHLRSLNELAKQAKADHIIHTGDFGFYDDTSLDRIADKTLRHVAQYSPLISDNVRKAIAGLGPPGPQTPQVKQRFSPDQLPLSEMPSFLNKTFTFDVPVYTVCGACEDVRVLERFRSKEYQVHNLNIIDEANSRLLDVGGIKLRLLGLGGAVVMHKLFDNGEGRTTIAGGQGTMWTTLLQMGELVDTANRVYDPMETRVLVTHASPAREGLLNQLSVTLKADFSISAGLHFRYGSSYNEFSVNPNLDHYRGKLAASKASFNDVWETVKPEVEPAVAQNDLQNSLLHNALDIISKMPSVANGGNPFGGPVTGPNAGGQVDESAFKNMWNFNLADAAFGYLVLEVDNGRIGTEMRAQGFNFAHRTGKPTAPLPPQQPAIAPASSSLAPGASNILAANTPTVPLPNRQQSTSSGPSPSGNVPQQPRERPGQHQGKGPSGPARNNQSPAPAVPNQVKPATPRPSSTNVNLPASSAKDKARTPLQTENVRNGTGPNDTKGVASPGAKPSSPTEKKPATALFVSFLKDEDAVRQLFPEEDRAKIVRVERFKNGAHVVHFNSVEEVRAALERQPPENKKRGEAGQPSVKIFRDHGFGPGEGAAGRWQGSNRGGANAGGQTGYRSGGASDSEGGRGGRGGSYRGAGRGRGDRGRGRGGRGSFNKASQGENIPAPSNAPAPSSGPAATPSGGDS